MWRGWLLLFVASPAFALSDGLQSILSSLLPDALAIAGAIFAAHVAMVAIKVIFLNFVHQDEVGEVSASFEKFSIVESNTDWSAMATHLDFHVEAPSGGDTLPDIDPALLGGFDEIDFMVMDDMNP